MSHDGKKEGKRPTYSQDIRELVGPDDVEDKLLYFQNFETWNIRKNTWFYNENTIESYVILNQKKQFKMNFDKYGTPRAPKFFSERRSLLKTLRFYT